MMLDPYRQIILDNLSNYGSLEDEELDPATVALDFAALNHVGISLERYQHKLQQIAGEVDARYQRLLSAGAKDTVETKLAALKHIIADQEGFAAIKPAQDQNLDTGNIFHTDLIEMIDQRAGLPILLSLLYLYVARQQGWNANVLNIPGHYVLRLDDGGARLIFDPSLDCRILQAADLRILVKAVLGEQAELSTNYYEPLGNRDLLLQLQNFVKIMLIQQEEYEDALDVVESLLLFAPDEYRLFLDAGLLYARSAEPQKAISFLEAYVEKTPDPRGRHEAALLMKQILETQ